MTTKFQQLNTVNVVSSENTTSNKQQESFSDVTSNQQIDAFAGKYRIFEH